MSQWSVKSPRWQALLDEQQAVHEAKASRCWLCHRRIDYSLPRIDRWGFTLDHIQSPRDAPDLAYALSNLKPAHKRCNSARGDGSNGTWRTSRDWSGRGKEAPSAGGGGLNRSQRRPGRR